MIKIKWEASNYFGPRIRKVESVKEDRYFVYLKGEGDNCHLKKTDDKKYCNTFKEAKKFLLKYFTEQVDRYSHCLKTAEEYLDEAKKLTPLE